MPRIKTILMAGTALASVLVLTPSPAAAQSTTKPKAEEQQEAETSTAKADRETLLDTITISATMINEAVFDSLSATSYVGDKDLERIQANTPADIFKTTPGVGASMNGDDPATAINIRGLQQYGRVVVTLDGARQDYWRVGHGSGSFYIEPDLLKAVTVIRGPVSNAYGSGGIGGLVAFETKDAGDFLNADEQYAISEKIAYESNGEGFTTSTTAAIRPHQAFDIIGNVNWRDRDAYEDGHGDEVRWTGEEVTSGYGKATFRPAQGHEIKLGAIIQRYEDYVTGSSGSTSATLSRYDADTINNTYTAKYTYFDPDDRLLDYAFTAYHNKTKAEQTQVWPTSSIGNFRYYDVRTTGISGHNSSRFDWMGLAHTLTYGGDYYYLEGESSASHFGQGEAQAYGGFLQWMGHYSSWLELIAAIRYDGYHLDGETKGTTTTPPEDESLDGDQVSPRFTVGVTPFTGFQLFGGYSEGYRAPGLQDVFRGSGAHDTADGYIPNFGLKPEVAKSWEGGVNLKYDGILTESDILRGKFTGFYTKVYDYIETDFTITPRMTDNIGTARLQGVEAELIYDLGWGFINLTGALIDAELIDTDNPKYKGQPLENAPLDKFSATVGFRAFEDQLIFGGQYLAVGEVKRTQRSSGTNPGQVDGPAQYSDAFELVNLFANWIVSENLKIDLAVENLFDVAYTDPQSAWSYTSDVEQGKGRTFKIGVTTRFGG
ncbi:TonB-dependent receptor domain-containing protein [Taklimakanibacter lacteus]|uniref:TonB-dependent receptor domain-containing protein n=1 Tax=Taklimakanibacter lacteus TaxID=2268456 RepID=UPI0034D54377